MGPAYNRFGDICYKSEWSVVMLGYKVRMWTWEGIFFKKNTIVYEESQFISFLKWSEEQVKSQHEFRRPGHERSEVALQGPAEEEGGSLVHPK